MFRPSPRLFREALLFLGIELNTTSHLEKLLATLGACIGIAGVWWAAAFWLGATAAGMVVASMGATAVLVFAVPHGALSQPWPVLVGHLVSAVIGVSCQKLLPGSALAPALAVGLAVGAMYYLRSIHPPGGATAITAVIGGEAIHSLGYGYVLFPVLFNTLAILALAVAFSAAFPWRRYPARWASLRQEPVEHTNSKLELTHEDFAAAMQELNSLVDVTADELARLFELAVRHAEQQAEHPTRLHVGRFYSNGQLGQRWQIRQVIDGAGLHEADKGRVIYKTVAGERAGETGISSTADFRQWARFEVVAVAEHWLRVDEKTGKPRLPPGAETA